MENEKIILGIDPGTMVMGYGLIKEQGKKMELMQMGGKFKAIVAFTDKEIDGHVVTESSLNGFPSSAIEDKIEEEPYRLLVVAGKKHRIPAALHAKCRN